MTTTIVYPDPSTGATTVDGHVRRASVSETFSGIRTGSGSSHGDTWASENCAQLTADATPNTDKYTILRRGIFTADTTGVPSGDTVSSFVFSIYGSAKQNGLGEPDLDVVSATPASNNDLVNADYAYGNFGTSPYGSIAYSAFSTSAYNDITCSPAAVNKAGITKLGLRLAWDTDNSAPTWVSAAVSSYQIYFADQSGTTNDPKLTIIHSAATRRVFVVA